MDVLKALNMKRPTPAEFERAMEIMFRGGNFDVRPHNLCTRTNQNVACLLGHNVQATSLVASTSYRQRGPQHQAQWPEELSLKARMQNNQN